MSNVDKKYRRFVAAQPCLVCEYFESAPHHHRRRGHGSVGMKCSDYRCLPLCYIHHDEYHRTSWPFWAKHAIDPEIEIARLNSLYFFPHGVPYVK